MEQRLTLQINSLEALERLIGGDSEIEIDIRNSVVQKFSKKHFKSIAKDEFLQQELKEVSDLIKTEINNQIKRYIGEYSSNGYQKHIILKEDLKNKIRDEARQQARIALNQFFKDNDSIKKLAKEQAEYCLEGEIAKHIQRGVKRKLEEAQTIILQDK